MRKALAVLALAPAASPLDGKVRHSTGIIQGRWETVGTNPNMGLIVSVDTGSVREVRTGVFQVWAQFSEPSSDGRTL